jgi:hypothetical protein
MIVFDERTARTTLVLMFLSVAWMVPSRPLHADDSNSGDWKATAAAVNCTYTDEVWKRTCPDGFWQLEMTLANCGTSAIEVSTNDLPWGWRYAQSKAILAIRSDSGASEAVPLPHALPLRDPMPGKTIRVEPKQVLKGSIKLDSYIDGLGNALKSSSVIVFWTWKLDSSDRVGGWVEIPKTPPREEGTKKGEGE